MMNAIEAPPVELMSANGGFGTLYSNVTAFGPDFVAGDLKQLQIPYADVNLWDVYRQRLWARVSGTLSPTLTFNLEWFQADHSGAFATNGMLGIVSAVPVPNTTTRVLVENDVQVISLTGSGTFANPWGIRLRCWSRVTIDDRVRFGFGDWTNSEALNGDFLTLYNTYAFSAANVSNTLREELGTWDRSRGSRLT